MTWSIDFMFEGLRIERDGAGEATGGARVDVKVTEFKLHVKQTTGPFQQLEPEVCVTLVN